MSIDLRALPPPDRAAMDAVRLRATAVLRPSAAFARLDEVAVWLAGWQRTVLPTVSYPVAIVFVGDHGIAEYGVSAYPSSVTAHMLRALRAGKATASVMARQVGARLEVVDVGVGEPTRPLHLEAALDQRRFAACLEAGRVAVANAHADLLVLGEMGIGNTTAAASLCASLYGGKPSQWVGLGTGIDAQTLRRKRRFVAMARRRVAAVSSPLELLRELGGCEMAAIGGALVEARRRSIPVLLDGFIVTAVAAALAAVDPHALDHCLAAHVSAEMAHRRLLDLLGLRPLLDLDLRLGEGTGALAALPLLRLAASCVTDVATFEEWGVRQ